MANKKNYNKISTDAVEKAEPIEIETVPEVQPEEPVEIVEEPKKKFGIVANCTKLNVRKAPKSNAPVCRTIVANTEVEIFEEINGFYKINNNEYCMKFFIVLK